MIGHGELKQDACWENWFAYSYKLLKTDAMRSQIFVIKLIYMNAFLLCVVMKKSRFTCIYMEGKVGFNKSDFIM